MCIFIVIYSETLIMLLIFCIHFLNKSRIKNEFCIHLCLDSWKFHNCNISSQPWYAGIQFHAYSCILDTVADAALRNTYCILDTLADAAGRNTYCILDTVADAAGRNTYCILDTLADAVGRNTLYPGYTGRCCRTQQCVIWCYVS